MHGPEPARIAKKMKTFIFHMNFYLCTSDTKKAFINQVGKHLLQKTYL